MKDLKNLFVPYTQALELKELGFDEPCITYYYEDTHKIRTGLSIHIDNGWTYSGTKRLETTLASTFSQAFDFFREKYNLLGCTQYFTGGYYCYTINDMKDTKESNRLFTEFSSFKEAELACLEKLIEIVKNK